MVQNMFSWFKKTQELGSVYNREKIGTDDYILHFIKIAQKMCEQPLTQTHSKAKVKPMASSLHISRLHFYIVSLA